MAFNDSRWVRQTLAFNSGRVVTDQGNENGPALFTYASSTDNIATITAANYFADVVYDLAVGDILMIEASDADGMYMVATVDRDAGTITVSGFAPTNSVDTANIVDGAVTAPKIASDAVTTAKILAANVTLAKLASGIAPAYVVKYGAQYTTTGGAAAEAIAVAGVAATDLVFVQLKDNGTNNVSVVTAAATLNTVTVTFSADPGADAVIYYQVLRAAS